MGMEKQPMDQDRIYKGQESSGIMVDGKNTLVWETFPLQPSTTKEYCEKTEYLGKTYYYFKDRIYLFEDKMPRYLGFLADKNDLPIALMEWAL